MFNKVYVKLSVFLAQLFLGRNEAINENDFTTGFHILVMVWKSGFDVQLVCFYVCLIDLTLICYCLVSKEIKWLWFILSIDATAESGRLGRLINHSRNGNCCTKAVMVKGNPHLILVASRDIRSGEELSYDYGDRSKAALEAHPWLKSWWLWMQKSHHHHAAGQRDRNIYWPFLFWQFFFFVQP